MPLTEEQKRIKNEKAKENRLKKKMEKAQSELVELEENKEHKSEPEIDTNDNKEEEETKRKMEIAEKRRKTLEIARSKRVSPTQIRKNNEEEMMRLKEEKEQEMMKMKEENEKLKTIADEKQKIKIVKKYIQAPIPMKKKKSQRVQEVAQVVPQVVKEPTIDYLAEQNYAQQLKKQLRDKQIEMAMIETFGGF
jgi:hypothetical protein